MPYGTIKIDTVTFTDAGVDKSVTLSGLVQNPTFSGNVTVTGTLSGVTVTGTTANFTSGNFTNISGGTHTITSGVFAAGSAASPSITFTGDLNTGIYSPGADQVAISTGGSGRLFINSAGQVGVGLSPSYQLDVAGALRFRAQGYLYDTAGTSQLIRFTEIASRDARMDAFNGTDFNGTLRYAGANLIFETGSGASVSERARIDSSGRLGVGTSSPSSIMHLATETGVSSELRFSNPANNWSVKTGTSGNSFSIVENQFGGTALFVDSALRVGVGTTSPSSLLHLGAASGTVQMQFNNGGTSSYLGHDPTVPGFDIASKDATTFRNFNGALFAETMRITSAGRVGIGTSSPDSTLHIATTASSTVPGFRLSSSGSLANNDIFRVQISGLTNGFRMFQDASSNVRYTFEGGSVGIGTTSPTHLLTVNGDIRRTGTSNVTVGDTGITAGANYLILGSLGGLNTYLDGGEVYSRSSTATIFNVNSSERARIDSSGRLLVGTSTSTGAPSNGAVIQLADQYSVRAVNGGGITNRVATTGSATTLNCVIDVPISGNIYSSFIGTLYICQQLTDSSKSFLAEYRVKIYNSGASTVFALVDSVDGSSPNNVALTFAYSTSNRQITVTSTWTTATSSAITCTLVGAGVNV